MADNLALSAPVGSGANLATDEISSVHHQRVKVEFGIDGAAVDVSSNDPLPVTLAAAGGLTSLQLIDDVVGTQSSTAPTKGNVVGGVDGSSNFQRQLMDSSGRAVVNVNSLPNVTVGSALPAGSNNIGDVDLASAIPAGDNVIGKAKITNSDGSRIAYIDANSRLEVTSYIGGTWYISSIPSAVFGCDNSRFIAGSSTNATIVKSAAGNLYGYEIYNASGATRYVKFHNASTTPTAGSTAVFYTVVIPTLTTVRHWFPQGIKFSIGISLTTVTGFADSDSAAVTANDLIVQVQYS